MKGTAKKMKSRKGIPLCREGHGKKDEIRKGIPLCREGHGKKDERSFFMKFNTLSKTLCLILCAGALTGCSAAQPQAGTAETAAQTVQNDLSQGSTTDSATQNPGDLSQGSNGTASLDEPEPKNSEELLDTALVTGYVTDFSSTSLQMMASQSEAGGDILKTPASDSATDEPPVTVRYADGCIFQTARIQMSNGALTLENISADTIKKSMDIAIYGERQSDGTILAKKVFVLQFT